MGTYKYDERETSHRKYFFSVWVFHCKDKEEVGEVHNDASRVPKRSTELHPCWTQGRKEIRQVVPDNYKLGKLFLNFHFWPENLLAAHATKIFKAVASDPDATEDAKDPIGEAEKDEDDLDNIHF